MRLPLLFAGLLLIQGSAFAQNRSSSYIDAYYSFAKLSVDGTTGSSEDNGMGAKAWIGRSWPIVTFEYSQADFDGDLGTGDVEQLRAGAGVRLVENKDVSLWLRGEYLTIDLQLNGGSVLDDEGLGAHLGVAGHAGEFGAYLEAGGLKNTDSKGLEFTAGASYEPANWGLFMEYRQTRLELEKFLGEPNIKLGEMRAGVRWIF